MPDTAPKPGEPGTPENRAALRRMAISLGVFLLCGGLAYILPARFDFRPWVPGDPLPMKRLVTSDWSRGITGHGDQSEDLKGERARTALAADFGESLAANLGSEAGVEQMVPAATQAADVEAGRVFIDKGELDGVVRTVEDPSGRALDAFYDSLYRSATGQKVTRVAHWGDSTIAADDVTGTLRRRFQRRFGDSGHGFMLVGKGTMPYRHADVRNEQKGGWKQFMVIRGERRDGRYGYGGVSFTSKGDGSASYSTATGNATVGREVSSFEVYYLKTPGGKSFSVAVDGARPTSVSTASQAPEDAFHAIAVTAGPHKFDLRAESGVTLYGVVLEKQSPGVVYDSLGIVGARAQRLQNADAAHFAAQVAHRGPDLLVLAFGGNECGDVGMDFGVYRANLKKTVELARAGQPGASCMLLAPLDQGEVDSRGNVRTIPIVPKIVESQRAVAAEAGCAFFDTFSAMGGEGAMGRWYKARPRLGWGDYRHATPAGYEVVGNMIYKAIMSGFVDWLAAKGLGGLSAQPAAVPATPQVGR